MKSTPNHSVIVIHTHTKEKNTITLSLSMGHEVSEEDT